MIAKKCPGNRKQYASPRERAENIKMASFSDAPQSFGDARLTIYLWSPPLEIIPGTEKCAL
jgi:hypothetical protein